MTEAEQGVIRRHGSGVKMEWDVGRVLLRREERES